ncbi:MAG TPA: hypothetical protein VGP36_00760 [Mycobacteriales bacterium]|jgi:hypothetical protein|nr:hypothetical protein [Mycobacteriales bacterium]
MAIGLVDPPVRTDDRRSRPGRLAAVRERLRRPERDAELDRIRRLEGTTALLERARAMVADGWVQDSFYVVRGRTGETKPVSPFGLLLLTRSDVVGACLVGAVAHASATVDRQDRRSQAALAVDTLWQALAEDTGAAGPPDTAHPAARAARVRELAHWNDEPQRSREDVLGLLDRSISHTIIESVR